MPISPRLAPAPLQPPSCKNGIKDGYETAVDCGGKGCHKCLIGQGCLRSTDCESSYCKDGTCVPQVNGCRACLQGGLACNWQGIAVHHLRCCCAAAELPVPVRAECAARLRCHLTPRPCWLANTTLPLRPSAAPHLHRPGCQWG